MKHAIIILAHNEYAYLEKLVKYFHKDCYLFIHFDKKGSIKDEEIKTISKYSQVAKVYQKFTIHWGGYSMLRCEMFMLQEAFKCCDADYFHLLSGQDYPIKSLDYFLGFFEEHEGENFISYVHLPHPNWQQNTFSRFTYFNPYDWIKHGKRSAIFLSRIHKAQDRLNLKLRIPYYFPHLYGGSQWFSITRNAAEVALQFTESHPAFYRRLRWVFAPEECYLPTVLLNKLSQQSVNQYNMRYIRWRYENGNSPSNLGVEHFHLLVESKCLFARKMKSPCADALIKLIDGYLLEDACCKNGPTGTWNYNGLLRYKYDASLPIALFQYCKWMGCSTLLDVGCGAGLLVAALRRYNIVATGVDSNPYTPHLSSLLLPEHDTPCQCFDFTGTLDSQPKFDVVVCLDVLQHIPRPYLSVFINNLCKVARDSMIISLSYDDVNRIEDIKTELQQNLLLSHSYNMGMSAYIESMTSVYRNFMVFDKFDFKC